MAWRFFFVWIFQVTFSRLRYRWRSLIAVTIALLLVAAIGAIIPLYTTAISQVGMIQRVENNPAEDIQLFRQVTVIGNPADLEQAGDDYRQFFHQQVAHRLQNPFSGWIEGIVSGVETSTLALANTTHSIHLGHYDDWQDQVELIEGDFPQQRAEGVLSLSAARSLGIQVGDQIELTGFGQNIAFTLTGIVVPRAQVAGYWVSPSPLRLEQDVNGNYTTVMLLPHEHFFSVFDQPLTEVRVQFKERVLFDYEKLPFDEIQTAAAALKNLTQDFDERRSDYPSGITFKNKIDRILLDYYEETLSLKQSFQILILQVGFLAILFLFVISELVRRSEHAEIAMLQNRGARNRHLIGEQVLEVMILGSLITLIAPWVAKLTIIQLVPLIGNLDYLPLRITWASYAYSGLASLLASFILVATLTPILRQSLIARGGSQLRSARLPWWRRYYLDFGLLILALLGLWQLMSIRTDANGSPTDFTQSDPLLLLTPTVALIALGSLLLRFFPPTMSLIAYLLAAKRGLMPVLASRQVSREPVHYARIALLLGLAVGMGGFVTSYHSTILHNQVDQSHYQAGADARIVEKNSESETIRVRPLEFYTDHPTVAAASPVLRLDNVDLLQSLYQIGDGNILAVDFETLAPVAHWRADLGNLPAPYSESGSALPAPGELLPTLPQKIGLWARLELSLFAEDGSAPYYPATTFFASQSHLRLRLRDAQGTYFHVPLEVTTIDGIAADELEYTLNLYAQFHSTQWPRPPALNNEELAAVAAGDNLSGWVYWEADLSSYEIQDSLSLESVLVRYALPYSFSSRSMNNWRLNITDFILIDDQTRMMPNWTAVEKWAMVPLKNAVTNAVLGSTDGHTPTMPGLSIQWGHAPESFDLNRSFALLLSYPPEPRIPVIASESFLEENNLEVGMNFERYLLQSQYAFNIIGSTAYYPTLYNDEEPFLIIDLDTLLYALNRHPTRTIYPSEVWISLVDEADLPLLLDDLSSPTSPYFIVDQVTVTDLQETVQTDPLSIGLLGLLYFSFGIVLVFSTIMLLTYTVLTVRFRQANFGVLQAFGVSSRQIVLGLAMEQFLVIGFASIVGTILGYALTLFVLPALANSATTSLITPPLIVYVSQSAIARHIGFMVLVLMVLLASNLLLIRQLSPAETIKLGDE